MTRAAEAPVAAEPRSARRAEGGHGEPRRQHGVGEQAECAETPLVQDEQGQLLRVGEAVRRAGVDLLAPEAAAPDGGGRDDQAAWHAQNAL